MEVAFCDSVNGRVLEFSDCSYLGCALICSFCTSCSTFKQLTEQALVYLEEPFSLPHPLYLRFGRTNQSHRQWKAKRKLVDWCSTEFYFFVAYTNDVKLQVCNNEPGWVIYGSSVSTSQTRFPRVWTLESPSLNLNASLQARIFFSFGSSLVVFGNSTTTVVPTRSYFDQGNPKDIDFRVENLLLITKVFY